MTRALDLGRRRPEGCLSDRALDGLGAGELIGDARAKAEAHVGGCAACSARRREHAAARRAFPLEAPSFEALVSRRPARARRWPWVSLGGGLVATAVGAAAVVLAMTPRPQLDGTREKGGDRLAFFVLHEGVRRAAASGEIVHPGDRLQLAYSAARAEHLAVLSRDAAGRAAIAFPRGDAATPIDTAMMAPLPYSLALDAELGRVTVYGLFCARAEPLGPVRAALERDDAKAAWPAGCHIDRFVYDVRP